MFIGGSAGRDRGSRRSNPRPTGIANASKDAAIPSRHQTFEPVARRTGAANATLGNARAYRPARLRYQRATGQAGRRLCA